MVCRRRFIMNKKILLATMMIGALGSLCSYFKNSIDSRIAKNKLAELNVVITRL